MLMLMRIACIMFWFHVQLEWNVDSAPGGMTHTGRARLAALAGGGRL